MLSVLAGAAVALVVAAYVAIRAQALADRRRGFVGVPMRAIAECSEGELVRIVGVVEAGDSVLKAPSDGAKCVFYASDFFSLVYRDRRRTEKRYAATAHASAFWLSADGQRAHVDVKRVDVTTDDTWGQELDADELPKGIRKQLLRSIPEVEPAPRSRYLERRLAPGARVTVVGVARWTEGPTAMPPAPTYRRGPVASRVLTIVAPPGGVVRVSTDESTRR